PAAAHGPPPGPPPPRQAPPARGGRRGPAPPPAPPPPPRRGGGPGLFRPPPATSGGSWRCAAQGATASPWPRPGRAGRGRIAGPRGPARPGGTSLLPQRFALALPRVAPPRPRSDTPFSVRIR